MTTDTPLKGAALWFTAIVLATANFVAVLDMTIANVSVPNIAGALGISSSQGTWVITSYSVAEAIIVPLTGWLAGRFGAVRVFVGAMMMFASFSAFCGLSNSLGMLVAGRIMQGLSGGPLMPLSQTLLLKIFPKEKAAAATALWAMTTLVAPVAGPILGGWICDNHSWPGIFYINLPVIAICAPIAWKMLRRYESDRVKAPIDVVGLALLVIFVGALQIMLDLGKDHDWFESSLICWLAIVAVIGFAAFLIWEFTEKHPIVDLRVFRHRGYAAGVVTLSLVYGTFFGANVLTPLWLQSYMGYTATWAGETTAWTGGFAVFMAPVAGMLLGKGVDPRRLIFVGTSWLALVTASRTIADTDMTYWQISAPLMLMGLGLPFFFVPVTALALGNVEEHETASAAGLMNFLRTLSGAFATSIVQTAWDDKTTYMHAELSGLADASGEVTKSLLHSGVSMEYVRLFLDHITQSQAVMLATNHLMGAMAICFALGAFVIWLAPRPARAIALGEGGH